MTQEHTSRPALANIINSAINKKRFLDMWFRRKSSLYNRFFDEYDGNGTTMIEQFFFEDTNTWWDINRLTIGPLGSAAGARVEPSKKKIRKKKLM